MDSPVAGFRPLRAARKRGSNEPKPVIATLLPLDTCCFEMTMVLTSLSPAPHLIHNGVEYSIHN